MKKITVLFAILALFCGITCISALEDGNTDQWYNNYESPINLELSSVEIRAIPCSVNDLRKGGNNTLGGPGRGPGVSNFISDAYTAPTWASTFPTICSVEQYEFAGDTSAVVSHRLEICNNAGPYPTPVSLAFVWQMCGNIQIFPPMPALLGTTLDGTTLAVTLPYSSACCCWLITVNVDGFEADELYDWIGLAEYTGITPIPVPVQPGTDMIGADPDLGLHNPSDLMGDGLSSGRPWCFQTVP